MVRLALFPPFSLCKNGFLSWLGLQVSIHQKIPVYLSPFHYQPRRSPPNQKIIFRKTMRTSPVCQVFYFLDALILFFFITWTIPFFQVLSILHFRLPKSSLVNKNCSYHWGSRLKFAYTFSACQNDLTNRCANCLDNIIHFKKALKWKTCLRTSGMICLPV